MTEPTLDELHDDVVKAEEALNEAKAREAHQEYPKLVAPHESHVLTAPGTGHISVPGFASHHIDRHNVVTVLVHDAEEEAKALAAKEAE